jgi:flagellar biosynthetic protein FliR
MMGFAEIRQILSHFGVDTDPEAFVTLFTLAMARMGAAVRFVPFLGGTQVPGNVQVALTVLIAAVLYPTLTANSGPTPGFGLYLALLVKEVLVGVLIGLLVQIVFAAVEAAGTLVEFSAGLKPAEIMAPGMLPANSDYGRLLAQAAIVLYLSAGVHFIFIRTLADSYNLVPLLSFPAYRPGFPALAIFVGKLSAGFIAVAFQLSAPIILLLALIQIGSNFVFRTSFASVKQDPFQPLGSMAVCAAVFLAAGLWSGEWIRQAGTYLGEIRMFLIGLR